MTNRVDFYLPEQTALSIPACGVCVYLDGTLCPFLQPVEIVRASWPAFGSALLQYNPATYQNGTPTDVKQILQIFEMGKSLSIGTFYNSLAPGGGSADYPLFEGNIEGIRTKLTGEEQLVEITARDISACLKRITVFGRQVLKTDGSVRFFGGFDTIFNPDGRGNASESAVQTEGKSYTVFCHEDGRCKFWSYADVIIYLLNECVTDGLIGMPDIDRLRNLTAERIPRDLDVTGLDLITALHRCCQASGLSFIFVPRPDQNGPKQAIVFQKAETARVVQLNCQRAGSRLSISGTNIAVFDRKREFYPVTRRYTGQGDFKVFEATFELIKAWDGSLEDDDYELFCPSTNPQFYQVRDVYRKWALNEAGQYLGPPYNRGDTYDFSKIFEGDDYLSRCRRFFPALTCDRLGRSLGYYLEVSCDNGQSWRRYQDAFNILSDECGIWLSSDRLDTDIWNAAVQDMLRFRITASVVGDQRLTVGFADDPVGSTVPVIDHILTLPRRFKYRKVTQYSIFAECTDPALGEPDQTDDTEALYEYTRLLPQSGAELIETVEVKTPFLAFDYQPGDVIDCDPDGRDLLGCRSDSRGISRIEKVRMDFVRQCTNLRIVRTR